MAIKSRTGTADSQATLVDETITLRASNFVSRWFFLWVLPIIKVGGKVDINDLKLKLAHTETARINVDLLDAAWKAELAQNPK